MGARGRARYDAGGTVMLPAGELGTHYRGPMFVAPPLVTQQAAVALMVTGTPLAVFRYFAIDEGGVASSLSDATLGSEGNVRITLRDQLQPGLNQLCLVVAGASATSDTRNCIDIAYLR
jgi:hypothetical protein